jgi:ribosome biogenesis GTPase A
MHLTRQAIADAMKGIDLVVEMLDARLPGSSGNPLLAELTQGKPTLKVLNKADIADPAVTALWLDFYKSQAATGATTLNALEPAPVKRLLAASRDMLPGRGTFMKPMRMMICGVPNVGKSTLINSLVKKKSAKTGDEAGVTKSMQRHILADGFYLYDTPGVLWPRIFVHESGFNLAASGAVGKNAYDDVEVALVLLAYLRSHYPTLLDQRYKLGAGAAGGPSATDAATDDELLHEIGQRRGALKAGGFVDMQKTAEALVSDFRNGALGAVSLETPQEYEGWLATGHIRERERSAKKEEAAKARAKVRSGVRH